MKLNEIVIELDLLRGTTGGEIIINPWQPQNVRAMIICTATEASLFLQREIETSRCKTLESFCIAAAVDENPVYAGHSGQFTSIMHLMSYSNLHAQDVLWLG
jgi:hypothetical protein